MADFKFKLPFGGRGGQAAPAAETGVPIFLMVGSLSGVTRKEAMLYARGLAEANVISPAMGRVQVTHDKARDRYVYEVHEGGIEYSIAVKVMEALDAGGSVSIALVNGSRLTVEESHGELFSLIHQPVTQVEDFAASIASMPLALGVSGQEAGNEAISFDAAAATFDVSAYAGKEKLLELFPEDKKLFNIGAYLLVVSFLLFISLGLGYTLLQAGWFHTDSLLLLTKAGHATDVSDSPVWQLEKALNEADKAGTSIKTLKKSPRGWSWELAQ